MTGLALAIVHHLIVFGLAAVLAAELALMRPAAMSPHTVRLLGRFDAAYGMLALAILAAGFIRVRYGAKGPDFYLHNHASTMPAVSVPARFPVLAGSFAG